MGTGSRFQLPSAFHIHYDGIDDEHEELVTIVNGLLALRGQGRGAIHAVQMRTFVESLEKHFENEKNHMENLAYPGLEWHREHHAECLERAQALRAESDRRGGVDDEIIEKCFEEVVHEVARADLKFCEFLDGLNLERDE